MSQSTLALSSTHWWRVAALKPRLRGHVHVHRHVYRGRTWYVVEDRVAAKHYRFNVSAYRVIDLFDGRRSLQEIWERLGEHISEDTPTQEEIVQLLGQLNGADLLQFDAAPDVAELAERRSKERRKRFLGRFLNPMSIRIPLLDPDRLLVWLARALQPLLGWRGVLLWLAVVLPALVLAPSHWPDLTRNFSEQLLAADNLLLMALVFPLLKACHELGHGLALKRRGSEVHEMGVMLLVFFPVPYVDASGAAAYADKGARMLVGAAGMLTELFIAALAFYAWLLLEPGLARSLAYNVVVIGSITTVLFNANPLLRFDGYYVLMDAIEVPNLGQRANRFWLRLIEERVFGVPPSRRAEEADLPAERRWFCFYAPAALVYRLSVSLGIALFIATEYFFFGVAMAVWTLASSIAWPLAKGLAALWREPRFRARAGRVRAVLAGTAVLGFLALFVVPMPHHTHADGVVSLPEDALLRAGANGFASRLAAQPGDRIAQGQVLLESIDPELRTRVAEQEAKLEEAQSRVDAAWGTQPARAGQLQDALQREAAALARVQDEAEQLTLRARSHGALVSASWQDLPLRYVKKGEVLGYLVGEHVPVVRVVVPQDHVDPVRLATRGVEVKLPQSVATTLDARLLRQVPKAGKELPSAALGLQGGGDIALDPQDDTGVTALQSVFEFEVQLPRGTPLRYLGSRAWVRFEHPPEPVGRRWLRSLRRLFLSHFGV